MDKNLAALLGAVGALAATAPAAGAAPVNARPALQAASYADLFKPIANAVEVLKQADAVSPATADAPAVVQEVQFHHHHHHHHHRRRIIRYHHHHHHHHHHRRPLVAIVP